MLSRHAPGTAQVGALLCDLDGVIRHWPKATTAAIERDAGLPPGALPRAAFEPSLIQPAITGHISHEDWCAQVSELLAERHPGSDVGGVVKRWSASPGEVDQEVLGMLQEVRRRVPLVLVTNATSRLLLDLAALGLASAFDAVVNASVVGHAKPDEPIYRAALLAAGVEAEAAAFVDDREENVEAALRLGMRGHLFQTAAGLREALRAWGLVDA